MAHISRRELKKDEVRATLAHGAEAVLSHQQLVSYLLLAAVIVGVGVYSWWTYSRRQTDKAAAVFDQAMKGFQAPILPPNTPPNPNTFYYFDPKTKYTEADNKFSDLAAKYPRTRPGQLASYYAALSEEKLSKNEQARERLEKLSGGKNELAAMAQFELARLDDRMGHGEEAAKLYQQLIDKPTLLVPKPVVMFAFAEHYRESNPAQAAKLYGEIKSQYPNTQIADEATRELALLPGKS